MEVKGSMQKREKDGQAKPIMVVGTASSAGKSLLATGLCRVFMQDGYKVAPFKSQNMALNSYITRDGKEMGGAQAIQAEAAGLEPEACMNPILLKPTGEAQSQLIVMGNVQKVLGAAQYYEEKAQLRPVVEKAYNELAKRMDVVVLEGAGSPAEINLKQDDFVNMGMAEIADAPVLLVGDIDRGGVFASLYGTVELLEPEERKRIQGIVINKFRGDVELLKPGLKQLEELTGICVLGVVPYLPVVIEEEDSLTTRFDKREVSKPLRVGVVRFPRMSNFTDFAPLEQQSGVSVEYLEPRHTWEGLDALILPGSENPVDDLLWMRQNGMEARVKKMAARGTLVLGFAGGYSLLGQSLISRQSGQQTEVRGMELLPVATNLAKMEKPARKTGEIERQKGVFEGLSGIKVEGTVAPAGEKEYLAGHAPFMVLEGEKPEGMVENNVLGTDLHGFFHCGEFTRAFVKLLRQKKGLSLETEDETNYEEFKQTQYDQLADALRQALDMPQIYRIMGVER